MKTNLNIKIDTDKKAVVFMIELYNNNEYFHPEDDAHDIVWQSCDKPSYCECEKLNEHMSDIYSNTDIDPCAILLFLDKNPDAQDILEGFYFITH